MSDPAPFDDVFSAEERGDTVGKPGRALIRILVVVVFIVGVVAVVFIGGRMDSDPVAVPTPSSTPVAVAVADAGAAATSDPAATTDPAVTVPVPTSTAPVATAKPEATEEPNPFITTAPTPVPQLATPETSLPINADYVTQAAMVDREDTTLYSIAVQGAAGASAADPAVVLVERVAPYTLADLISLKALVRTGPHTLYLEQRVVVQRGASLNIVAPGQTIRMKSGTQGFTSIVAWGGNLAMAGSQAQPMIVTSWDPVMGAPDTTASDGRAYIRVNDGAFSATAVDISSLGFWSGRTGGVALTGSSESPATGLIAGLSLTDMHIGLYLSGVQNVSVIGVLIDDAHEQGIEIANGSSGIAISSAVVERSGGIGINAHTGTANVNLTSVKVTGSGAQGLRFDGKPRADGPNSGGYGVANAQGLEINNSEFSGNTRTGIQILSTNRVSIASTTVSEKAAGIIVDGVSQSIAITDSTITSTGRDAIDIVDGVRDVVIDGTTVSGNSVGVLVRDSGVDITNNDVEIQTGNGIILAGSDTSGTVTGNTIVGTGPAAISEQAAGDVVIKANESGDWTARTEAIIWADRHPLAWLWAALLLVPAVGVLFIARRVRRQRKIRQLVESTTIALARARKDGYERDRDVYDEWAPEAGPLEFAPATPVASPRRQPRQPPVAPPASPVAPPVPPTAPRGVPRPAALEPRRMSERPSISDPLRSGAPAERRPVAPPPSRTPPRRAPLPSAANRNPADGRGVTVPRVGRDVAEATSSSQFLSVEELAVAAVIEGGRPIDTVARTLRVSPSVVAYWVSKSGRGVQA